MPRNAATTISEDTSRTSHPVMLDDFFAALLIRNSLLTLVLVAFAGCDQSQLVRSTGTHKSPNGLWTVTVTRRSKSLVDYSISDVKTGAELARGGEFSDAMRWFLYWDEQNRLWAFNSDKGGFGYWTHTTDSSFLFTEIGPADDKSIVPAPVFSNLPSTVKRRLGWDQTNAQ